MPMSPSSFVPSVLPTGGDATFAQATQVAPEKNYAPQQIEQMGQAVSQAGGTAFRTGQSMARMAADTIDDANVKQAETQFLTNATQTTRSYLQTVGQQATDSYPQAQQDLAKAKQDAGANLTNPIQQRMYNLAAQQHLISFGGQMADHNHTQTVQYGGKSAIDRSDIYAQQAALSYQSRDAVDKDGNPTGDFNTNWNVAVQEAEKGAQLLYGAPPGSAISRDMVQKTTTKIVGSVVASLINDHASAEAKDYFDKEHALGHIDEDVARQLGNMIRTQADRDHNTDTIDDYIKDQLASHKAPAPTPGATDQGYQDWLKKTGVKESPDYDTYAAYKAGAVPSDDGHLTDQYKLPNHPTYSTESLASQKPGAPPAGEWKQGDNGKWTFKASQTNVDNAGGVDGLKAYFNQVEPGNTVVLPNGESYTGQAVAGEKSWEDFRPAAKSTSQPVVIQPVEGGSITSVMGESRAGGRIHNGIDIAVPPNTPIKAPTNGTVTNVWDDDKFGGGHSMEITFPDGTVTGFAHLTSTNYKEGDKVTQGQVVATSGGAAGAPGSGDSTGPHVHWMMKDPNGQYIDPRTYGGVPPKLENFTDPNDLEAVLQRIDASDESPYMKKEQKSYAESQYRHYRQIDDQQYEDLKKGVVDNWYAVDGDVSKFNPAQLAQFSQLRPGDQAQLRKGIPRESDEDTVLDLIAHPEKVVPGSIEQYRDQLSKGDYRSFFKQAIDNATPDSPKVRAVSMDNDQFDAILQSDGLQGLVSPKANTANSAKRIDWINTIRDRIDEAQTKAGGEIDRTAKAKLMNDVIAEKMANVKVDTGWQRTKAVLEWPWTKEIGGADQTGQDVPYANLTPAQQARAYVIVGGKQVLLKGIPKAFADAATIELHKRNQPATPDAIARYYVLHQQANPQPQP